MYTGCYVNATVNILPGGVGGVGLVVDHMVGILTFLKITDMFKNDMSKSPHCSNDV